MVQQMDIGIDVGYFVYRRNRYRHKRNLEELFERLSVIGADALIKQLI